MVKGFDIYAKDLKNASKTLRILADAETSASAETIARSARIKAPLNDGALRGSIQTDKLAEGKHAVNASAAHAPYIEFGTRSRAKIPSDLAEYAAQFHKKTGRTGEQAKLEIYEWCRKKGIPEERWFGIFISIMTHGIKPQPFLFPSVAEEEPRFYERLKKLLDNL